MLDDLASKPLQQTAASHDGPPQNQAAAVTVPPQKAVTSAAHVAPVPATGNAPAGKNASAVSNAPAGKSPAASNAPAGKTAAPAGKSPAAVPAAGRPQAAHSQANDWSSGIVFGDQLAARPAAGGSQSGAPKAGGQAGGHTPAAAPKAGAQKPAAAQPKNTGAQKPATAQPKNVSAQPNGTRPANAAAQKSAGQPKNAAAPKSTAPTAAQPGQAGQTGQAKTAAQKTAAATPAAGGEPHKKSLIPPEQQRPFREEPAGLQLDDSPLVSEDFRRFFTTNVTPGALFTHGQEHAPEHGHAHHAAPHPAPEEDEEEDLVQPPPPPARKRKGGLLRAIFDFFSAPAADDETDDLPEQDELIDQAEPVQPDRPVPTDGTPADQPLPKHTADARRTAEHAPIFAESTLGKGAGAQTGRATDGPTAAQRAAVAALFPEDALAHDAAPAADTTPAAGATGASGTTTVFEKQTGKAAKPTEKADGVTTIFEKPGAAPDATGAAATAAGAAEGSGTTTVFEKQTGKAGAQADDAPDGATNIFERQTGRAGAPTETAAAPETPVETAAPAEDTAPDAADGDDYTSPDQQPEIAATLHGMVSALTLRTVILGVLTLNALYFGLAALYPQLPQPTGLVPVKTSSIFVLAVYLVSLLVAGGISVPAIKNGLSGLWGEPSADSFAVLSWCGALVQVLTLLAFSASFDAAGLVFAVFALLALFVNTLGKRALAREVEHNFARLTHGQLEYSVAYLLRDAGLVRRLTHGLGEPDPYLLLSRPAGFYTGFLQQSFGTRLGDTGAQLLCRILPAAAVLAGVLGALLHKDFVTPFAAVLCTGCPLAMVLVSSVPTHYMNHSAEAIGTILPGPQSLEDLGQANVVVADAHDLFPDGSITLKGMKMFGDPRLDLAILYAASVLIPGCSTLRSVFLNIIQDRTEILYKVEHLTKEIGCGFEAWADARHLLVGTRGMMISHGVEVPPESYERKYTKEGRYCPVYLAVNGRLYAMFVVGYRANADVKELLDQVYVSGLSLLVTSDDFNLSGERINTVYGIPSGCIKVLGAADSAQLAAHTAPCSRCAGVMVHASTSFKGFIAGIRIAANASSMEKAAVAIQSVSVVVGVLLTLIFTCTGGLPTLRLPSLLLYQLGWLLLTLLLPVAKRY